MEVVWAKLDLNERRARGEPDCSDGDGESHLVLKLLRPVSIGRDWGEVVGSFVVVLLHCVKGVTAVRGEAGGGRKWGEGPQTDRQTDRQGGRQKKDVESSAWERIFHQKKERALSTLKWQDPPPHHCLCCSMKNKGFVKGLFTAIRERRVRAIKKKYSLLLITAHPHNSPPVLDRQTPRHPSRHSPNTVQPNSIMLPPLSQRTKTHCGVLTGWLASPPHDIIHRGQKLPPQIKKLSWALWWCVPGGSWTLTLLWNCLPVTNADCRDAFFFLRSDASTTSDSGYKGYSRTFFYSWALKIKVTFAVWWGAAGLDTGVLHLFSDGKRFYETRYIWTASSPHARVALVLFFISPFGLITL